MKSPAARFVKKSALFPATKTIWLTTIISRPCLNRLSLRAPRNWVTNSGKKRLVVNSWNWLLRVLILHLTLSYYSHSSVIPSDSHMLSTLDLTFSLITIGLPQSRSVSPANLLVASIPIFDPSPDLGEAKSK